MSSKKDLLILRASDQAISSKRLMAYSRRQRCFQRSRLGEATRYLSRGLAQMERYALMWSFQRVRAQSSARQLSSPGVSLTESSSPALAFYRSSISQE